MAGVDSLGSGAGGKTGAVSRTARWTVFLAGALLAGLFWLGLVGGDLTASGRACLGAASLAVGLWGSELVSLPVTALLASLLLYVSGAAPALPQAFSGFASPVFWFMLGSFGLGIAGEQIGLVDRLAFWLLARSRGSGHRLLFDLLLSLPLQALVVPSATSRNAVLVPVYDRLLGRIGRPPRLGAAVMLTLGVLGPLASTALLSGGTSPVAAAQGIGGFNWISWFVAVAPPYYVLLAISGGVLWFFARPEVEVGVSAEDLENGKLRGLSTAEWKVAAVAVCTSLLWIMDQFTHWPPAVPALLAMAVLLLPRLGVMSWGEFAGRAPWGTCFVLAGAISLAESLSRSGAAAWLARGLFAWFPAPSEAWAAALAIYVVTCAIALAVPNRAAAITLVIPLAAAYAGAGPLSVAAAGLVVLVAVDLETIYPAQTAANLIAYDRGYFDAGALARFNVLTLLAGALVLVFVALPWWGLVGLP